MFVDKDFARRRFLAQICANSGAHAHFAYLRVSARICATKQSRTKSLATNIGTIPKNMLTNFQLKRLKLKLDIVEKPENRVHKMTDSNWARLRMDLNLKLIHMIVIWSLDPLA